MKKKQFKYMTLLKAALMALLPVVCCLVRTAAEGRSIGQVYLPASEWNDELFYFKQVEGIVNYGFPRGFSDSMKAMHCSFLLRHGVRYWYSPGFCGGCCLDGI